MPVSDEPVERIVAVPPEESVRHHTCGRCRRVFDVAADVADGELTDWWVCASCRAAILPSRAGTP